jgi:adenine-specific DNA-methyltransferase
MKTGVHYTDRQFFRNFLRNHFSDDIHIHAGTKTLDFCCGTGNLFMSYLDVIMERYDVQLIRNIIINSVFIDIDGNAIKIFKKTLYDWIRTNLSFNINLDKNFLVDDGLLNVDAFKTKFDIILSNPPFINLKSNVAYKKKIKDLNYYKYSTNGMMDTYLVSIEQIFNLLESNGRAIIICPSQILTNVSCLGLRRHMIDTFSLVNVYKFPEKNMIFPDITQGLCILDVKNAKMDVDTNYYNCDYKDKIVINSSHSINASKLNYNIVSVTDGDYKFINNLTKFKKLKDHDEILCARGNIDITLDKQHIINQKTPYPLVRGKNIKSLDTITEYIPESVIKDRNIDVTNSKLVCQQICNINSKNRLNFILIKPHFVISNSCNYISSTDESQLLNLKHVLNSSVLNRYFCLFSGNNHISINELKNLPIPIELKNTTPKEIDDYFQSHFAETQ